jgi:hypothetical protein
MKASVVLTASSVALCFALPYRQGENEGLGRLGRRRTGNADDFAESHMVLHRIPRRESHPRTLGSQSLAAYTNRPVESARLDTNSSVTALLSLVQNNSYVGEISLGRQKLSVIIDTGSADTWVVQKNFSCIDADAAGNLRRAPVGRPFFCFVVGRHRLNHMSPDFGLQPRSRL